MKYSKTQETYLKLDPNRVREWETSKYLVKHFPKKYKFERRRIRSRDTFTTIVYLYKRDSILPINSFKWVGEL